MLTISSLRLSISLLALIFPIISGSNRRGPIRTGNSNVYSYKALQNNVYFLTGEGEHQKQKRLEFWKNKNFGSSEDEEEDDNFFGSDDTDEFKLGEIMREHLPKKKKKKKSIYQTRQIPLTMNHNPNVKRAASIKKTQKYFEGRVEMMQSYFRNTTSFVHGDTFWGLGRTTSGLLFAYFATIYCVYVLSTTLLLFQRRKDPSLSKFPLWLSHFFPAILNAIIVVLGFLRHMYRARFPCFIVLWKYGLLAPMYVVMIFEARSLNLIFEYHWNKRMQALLQASEPRSTLEGDINSPIIVLDRTSKKADPNLLSNSEDWLWIKKNGMIATIIGIFIFQFVMTSTIQYFSPYYRIWPKMMVYRCAGALETILPICAIIMYMFIIPLYLFIQLKRINDSYGVRKDIYSAVTQSAWISLLFTLVRHVFFVGKFIGYIPTGFAVMTTFGVLHYHTVCAPLVRIYAWQWSRSRVKRRVKKFILMKRKLESYIFPRFLRIKIVERAKGSGLKAPEPLKGVDRSGEARQKRRGKQNSSNLDLTPTPSFQSNNRLDVAASPSASMSPIIPPELKPPTFNQVLQDEVLCELFERYTLLEFSRENLLFYRAVCSLRSTFASLPTGAAQIFLVEKSRSMASQFIHINSPAEINIPGPVRKRIESRLAELDVDLTLFDEAQREVFRLMQNWSYPRFLRTLPDAEIRRFNRKARRNSTNAQLDHALASFSNTHGSTALNINNNNHNSHTTSHNPVENGTNHPHRPRADSSHELMATSVCSLTLPLNIAEVSLSASP